MQEKRQKSAVKSENAEKDNTDNRICHMEKKTYVVAPNLGNILNESSTMKSILQEYWSAMGEDSDRSEYLSEIGEGNRAISWDVVTLLR